MNNLHGPLDKLIRFFPALERRFVKDTLSIQLASVAAVLFQFPLSIILARTLRSELYGQYAVVLAVFNFFCIFLNWGPGPSFVPQFSEAYAARDRKEMERLIQFFWVASLAVVSVVVFMGYFTTGLLGEYFLLESSAEGLVKILLLSLFARPFSTFFLLLSKSVRDMGKLAVANCFQPFFFLCFTLVFLLWFGGVAAPVWGFFAAAYTSAFITYLFLRAGFSDREISLNPFRAINREFWVSMKSYFHFGFVLALEKQVVRLTTIIPTLLLGALGAPEAAGYFRIGMGYARISEYFFIGIDYNTIVKLSQDKGKNKLVQMKENYRAINTVTAKASFVLMILLVAGAPLFIRLYGQGYRGALPAMVVLSVAFCARGFVVAVQPFLKAMRWVDPCVYWMAGTLVALTPLGFFLIKNMGATGAAIFVFLVYIAHRLEATLILNAKMSTRLA